MDNLAPAEIAEETAAEFAIEADKISLWYDDFQALFEVSTKIKKGIVTSLIGPSGCGKTTFLRCYNRVNERFGNVRTTGEMRVLGKNIYDPDVSIYELRRSVGMVFQRPNPLPISVYDNVVFGLRTHSERGEIKKRELDDAVEKALREVKLWDDVKDGLERKGTRLQLEQQQKLCIARLLPLKPRVILMDEPCSTLDAPGTEAIEELMAELRGKYTIVIVTHNMAQARRASDECIFMLMGKIVEQAPTLDIFLRPREKDTENYVEGRYG